jgi:hypothetical protein
MILILLASAIVLLGVGIAVGGAIANRRSEPTPLPPPQATTQQLKMMGLVTPGDERVPVAARDWNGMRLALWRSKVAWDIVSRSAEELLDRCAHMEGCAAKTDETQACLRDCPDRELRMSTLVILNAARQFAPIDARKPADAPYFAPGREKFSAMVVELAVAQAELEAIRGAKLTEPPAESTTAPQLKEAAT